MTEALLKDKFNRTIRDLRISVTDRCNFRCFYCIPDEDIVWKRRQELLTYEEIILIAEVAVSLGVEKLRLTGGEPLLRRDIEFLVERLARIPGVRDLAMTTNADGLKDRATALRSAGLNRLTISCDSLKPEIFKQITRRDSLQSVLDGIEAALAAGFPPPKINCVVIRGLNDTEVADFADFARATGVSMRFIEYMPLDNGHQWDRSLLVSGREVLERIRERHELVPIERDAPSETALRYVFARRRAGRDRHHRARDHGFLRSLLQAAANSRRQSAHLSVLNDRSQHPRPDTARRHARTDRAVYDRDGLEKRGGPPHQRAWIRAAATDHVFHRRIDAGRRVD